MKLIVGQIVPNLNTVVYIKMVRRGMMRGEGGKIRWEIRRLEVMRREMMILKMMRGKMRRREIMRMEMMGGNDEARG